MLTRTKVVAYAFLGVCAAALVLGALAWGYTRYQRLVLVEQAVVDILCLTPPELQRKYGVACAPAEKVPPQ